MKSTKVNYNFKNIDFLLIASILLLSTSAMDRIDFWSGKGSFTLTPSVIFSIIFFVLYFFKLISCNGKLTISKELFGFLKAMLLLSVTVILSVFFSADFLLSAKRVVQFILFSLCGFLAVNYLYVTYRNTFKDIVAKCIYFQCYAYLALFLLDEIMWMSPEIHQAVENRFSVFDSALYSYGTYIVRTRGLNADPNRAGIFLVLCIFFLIEFCKPSSLKKATIVLCCVMTLCTISRTAMLCLAILLFFNIHRIKHITNNNFIKILISCIILLVVIIWILTLPVIQSALDVLALRFTDRSEGSAAIHVNLIEIGLDKIFGNLKILLVGNGYGASYTLLKGFYDVNKYANFHNGYITFLVECGILSMIFFVYLIIKPFLENKKCLSAVMVIALANIPYQMHAELYIWMLMPMLCLPIFENTNRRNSNE